MSTFAGYVENKEIYVQSENTVVRGEKTLEKVACAALAGDFCCQPGALCGVSVGVCFGAGIGTSQDGASEEGECAVELEDGGAQQTA